MDNSKACSQCKQIKNFDDFYTDSNTKRLRAACKKCVNKKNNEIRSRNPEEYRKTNLDYYYKNKERLNEERRANWPKIYEANIEQQREKHQKYRKENPEKIREFARRRRARKRMNGSQPYTESEVLRIYGTVCHICSGPIDITKARKIGSEGWKFSLQIDHVIPLAKGGSDTLENVKPAHARCNIAKGDKLFYQERNKGRD